MLHRPQQHFLARAAFPLDQNVTMPTRSGGCPGECGAETGRRAHHRLKFQHVRQLLCQWLQFITRGFHAGGAAQGEQQPLRRDGFDKVVCRPGAHCLNRQQRRCAGGQHQQRQGWACGFDPADKFTGILTRHQLIQQHRADLQPLGRRKHIQRRLTGIHRGRAPAFARGERTDQPGMRRIIINQHQEAAVVCRHRSRFAPLARCTVQTPSGAGFNAKG